MEFTHEQKPAISSRAKKIKLVAFAGSGKTTTLVGYAKEHRGDRLLYLCYNKSVEVEAKRKFPTNTTCKTSHGLAYQTCGAMYRHKLGNLHPMDVARALDTQDWDIVRAVQETLNNYLCSSDDTIQEYHCPPRLLETERQRRVAAKVAEMAARLWGSMLDVNSRLAIPHDGYLKAFVNSRPNLGNRFDTILVDEAQDLNPLLAGFLAQQAAYGVRVVVCGDEHQQLYRFRGSVDALSAQWLEDADTHYLTQSFRFGPALAHVANMVLKFLGERHQIKGLGEKTRIGKNLPEPLEHRAVLCRTVVGVIENALNLVTAGEKLYWIGGIEGYNLQDIEDIHSLMKGRKDLIKSKATLRLFPDYMTYKTVADGSGDPEMQRTVKLVEEYSQCLPEMFAMLRGNEQKDELNATVTLSTAHRAKGLEWDAVKLADDFSFDPFSGQTEKLKWIDEMNLLYVACTRARKFLAVNAPMLSIIHEYVARRDGKKPDTPIVFKTPA